MVMTLQEAKQQIVDTFKAMYHQNMVTLFEGNVSMRWEDHMLITPSQKNKETITADMIIEIANDGQIIQAAEGCQPSSEFKMHREVYRVRSDVNAVVHCPSAFATAFATAGKPLQPKGVAEINLLFGQIPLAKYGRARKTSMRILRNSSRNITPSSWKITGSSRRAGVWRWRWPELKRPRKQRRSCS